MINEDSPIQAWLEIHYQRNKEKENIKVAYHRKKYLRKLRDMLNRNDQPFTNPYGKDYLIAYPS